VNGSNLVSKQSASSEVIKIYKKHSFNELCFKQSTTTDTRPNHMIKRRMKKNAGFVEALQRKGE
jgi:hypothetical protein